MTIRPTHKVLQPIRISEDKTLWQELGVAWETKNGASFSVQLDSIPLSGRIILKRNDDSEGVGAI